MMWVCSVGQEDGRNGVGLVACVGGGQRRRGDPWNDDDVDEMLWEGAVGGERGNKICHAKPSVINMPALY